MPETPDTYVTAALKSNFTGRATYQEVARSTYGTFCERIGAALDLATAHGYRLARTIPENNLLFIRADFFRNDAVITHPPEPKPDELAAFRDYPVIHQALAEFRSEIAQPTAIPDELERSVTDTLFHERDPDTLKQVIKGLAGRLLAIRIEANALGQEVDKLTDLAAERWRELAELRSAIPAGSTLSLIQTTPLFRSREPRAGKPIYITR